MKLLFLKRSVLTLFFLSMASSAYPITLKIATVSPEGSMWMEKMRKGAETVAQKTDNRVKFKFYPGGVMGSDKDVFRKIRINQLQGGTFTAGSLSSIFSGCQLYGQLMKFNSLFEVEYVRKYMDDYIIDGLEKAGFVTFGLAGGGFAYIMSANPIKSVGDLQKQKIWIPDNDEVTSVAIKVFGIKPIPLSLINVKPSMQTGAINTVATSPTGAIILQWHTQVDYVVDMPFVYLYAALAVNKRSFLKIKEKDRGIVKKEMTKVFIEIGSQNNIDDNKAKLALKNRGIKFLSPSEEELAEWKSKAHKSSIQMIKSGFLDRDAVKKLDKHLKDYQKKQSE